MDLFVSDAGDDASYLLGVKDIRVAASAAERVAGFSPDLSDCLRDALDRGITLPKGIAIIGSLNFDLDRGRKRPRRPLKYLPERARVAFDLLRVAAANLRLDLYSFGNDVPGRTARNTPDV